MLREQRQNPASEPFLENYKKSRRWLVGAAGFEPATCSTQNCRATRLRYTPPGALLDTCFAGPQQAVRLPLQTPEDDGSPLPSVAVQKSASFLPRTRHANF